MIDKFARFLNYQQQVFDFLTGPLGQKSEKLPEGIIGKIITCEKGVLDGIENPTTTSDKFRDVKYNTEALRLELRKTIVDELFTKKLLINDDKIRLKIGGARPKSLKRNKQAYILIGLPASGKSSIAAKIAKKNGAIILDSDFAKRKLPEYDQFPWGASLVNSESSWIVFGDEAKTGFESLYLKALKENYNIIIPKIGAHPDDIIPYCINLKKLEYTVHLTLVYLPKEKSTNRALSRYIKSNRYVPLTLIFDTFSNNPALTYFMLKNKMPHYIDTYGIINTDLPRKKSFICTDLSIQPKNNPAQMYTLHKNVLI